MFEVHPDWFLIFLISLPEKNANDYENSSSWRNCRNQLSINEGSPRMQLLRFRIRKQGLDARRSIV